MYVDIVGQVDSFRAKTHQCLIDKRWLIETAIAIHCEYGPYSRENEGEFGNHVAGTAKQDGKLFASSY